MIATMITGSTQIGARLMTRAPPRLLMGPGFLVVATGMGLLTQLDTESSYAGLILPAMLLLGLGMGTAFMPAMSLATHGVQPRDAGIASAMVNTSQQVGGAIGTALLNTIAASATTEYFKDHAQGATSAKSLQLTSLVEGVHDRHHLGRRHPPGGLGDRLHVRQHRAAGWPRCHRLRRWCGGRRSGAGDGPLTQLTALPAPSEARMEVEGQRLPRPMRGSQARGPRRVSARRDRPAGSAPSAGADGGRPRVGLRGGARGGGDGVGKWGRCGGGARRGARDAGA